MKCDVGFMPFLFEIDVVEAFCADGYRMKYLVLLRFSLVVVVAVSVLAVIVTVGASSVAGHASGIAVGASHLHLLYVAVGLLFSLIGCCSSQELNLYDGSSEFLWVFYRCYHEVYESNIYNL